MASNAELVYRALLSHGASPVQALGIMANIQNESTFDPERINPLGPKAGVGLVQWETPYYPNVPRPTGNVVYDIDRQIAFLAQTGGFQYATGRTPQEAAANFAQTYERCGTCYAGGQQYQARVGNATALADAARTGNWPSSATLTSSSATLTSSTSSGGRANPCVIPLPFGTCLLHRSQVRGLLGGSLMAGGVLVGGLALLALAASSLGSKGAGKALDAVPGGIVAKKAVSARQASKKQASQQQGREQRAAASQAARTDRNLQASNAQVRYLARAGDNEGVQMARAGKLTRVQASQRISERQAAAAGMT